MKGLKSEHVDTSFTLQQTGHPQTFEKSYGTNDSNSWLEHNNIVSSPFFSFRDDQSYVRIVQRKSVIPT